MEKCYIKMEINIKVILKEIKEMEKEKQYIEEEENLKVYGKMMKYQKVMR